MQQENINKQPTMAGEKSLVIARNKLRKRAYHQAHKQEANIRRQRWTRNNPEKSRSMWLKKRYKITLDNFNTKLLAQGNVCASCKQARKLCVDHDHTTGKVRGLLCDACNKALGLLEEKQATLVSLIEYLGRWSV